MATLVYRTKDGDVLDDILYRQYGEGVKILQTVLKANPGLAQKGPVYRSGVEIVLPIITTTDVVPITRPWGTVS